MYYEEDHRQYADNPRVVTKKRPPLPMNVPPGFIVCRDARSLVPIAMRGTQIDMVWPTEEAGTVFVRVTDTVRCVEGTIEGILGAIAVCEEGDE